MQSNLKRCSKCKKTFDVDCFYKDKRTKDGLHSICKICCSKYRKEYYKRPGVKQKIKQYYQRPEVQERIKKQRNDPEFKNQEKEYMEKYRKTYVMPPWLRKEKNRKQRERGENPEVKKIRKRKSKEYRSRLEVKKRNIKKRQNPEFKKYRKIYYKKWLQNPEVQKRLKEYRKEYYQKNKKRIKNYLKNNPDKIREQYRNHYNKRKNLGTTILFDNPFPKEIEVDFHHFNKLLMIPIPRITHRFVTGHANNIGLHYNHSKKWIEKLYNINLDSLNNGECGNT